MIPLTAIILTHNEADQIRDCIATLQFADRILVFDSYSSDETVSIARGYGAEIIQHEFRNYADQRNSALEAVAGTTIWVLFVDADERVSPELAAEIQKKMIEPDIAGWKLPRHNYIFGVLTKGAGWYPDYQTRLLRVGSASYDPSRQVHEVVMLTGPFGKTINALVHHNYRDLAHFVSKQEQYVRYDAQILYGQGVQPKTRNFILQPLRHFRWRFVTLKGYRDRWHGFKLSVLMAWYEYRKYRLLAQLRQADDANAPA